MKRRDDRILGIILLLVAIGYGAQTFGFRVGGFTSDSLGPRAYPQLLAVLLGLFSLPLIFKPSSFRPAWPASSTWLALGGMVVGLVLYAYLIVPVGFILSTTLIIALMALLFNAPPLRSLLASFAVSLGLYSLFVFALGISLPVGRIFGG